MKICVFCASSRDLDPDIAAATAALGEWIGAQRHTLVWGGCNVGLMDVVGRAARMAGAHTIAVIPRFLVERGLAFESPDERIVTEDMQSRKAEFRRLADVFVALPGGVGSWEELFEVLALRKLGQLGQPILVANWDDYYAPLLLQLRRSVEARYTAAEVVGMLDIVADGPALLARLASLDCST